MSETDSAALQRRRPLRPPTPIASAALAALATLLTGCERFEPLFKALWVLYYIFVAGMVVLGAGLLVVVVMNVVSLVRGRPSVGWGAGGIAIGGVLALSVVDSFTRPPFTAAQILAHVFVLLLASSIGGVGFVNVRRANEMRDRPR